MDIPAHLLGKMMNFIAQMLILVLKCLDFVLKTFDFVLKMLVCRVHAVLVIVLFITRRTRYPIVPSSGAAVTAPYAGIPATRSHVFSFQAL